MAANVLILKQDDISWTATKEGAVVVLDLRSSEYLTVNASASGLWEMLAAGASTDALVNQLQTQFALSEEVAKRDVDRFLSDLRSRNLLDELPQ